MSSPLGWLGDITRITEYHTRSLCAENPDGAVSGGAMAAPGDDPWCTPAASELGRPWKVRPCVKDLKAGETVVLADVAGPGIVQHIWMTVFSDRLRTLSLRVSYDHNPRPSIETPLGDFFANGCAACLPKK